MNTHTATFLRKDLILNANSASLTGTQPEKHFKCMGEIDIE